jgi:hypothetical protein
LSTPDAPDKLVDELRVIALKVTNSQSAAPAGSAFANLKAALKEHCPSEYIDAVASLVFSGADAVKADEKHDERQHERTPDIA